MSAEGSPNYVTFAVEFDVILQRELDHLGNAIGRIASEVEATDACEVTELHMVVVWAAAAIHRIRTAREGHLVPDVSGGG